MGAVSILTLQVRTLSCSGDVTGPGSQSLPVAGPSCQPAPKTLTHPHHLPAITHTVPFADTRLDRALQPPVNWGPHQFTLLPCRQAAPASCAVKQLASLLCSSSSASFHPTENKVQCSHLGPDLQPAALQAAPVTLASPLLAWLPAPGPLHGLSAWPGMLSPRC